MSSVWVKSIRRSGNAIEAFMHPHRPEYGAAKRWAGFTCFLDDRRICLTNNATERALRGLALSRKSWFFAGSQRGAVMYTLIATARLNDVDPQAWLADVLARSADTGAGKRWG